MANPNDITAEIYDIVSSPLKGRAITDAEISMINFLAEPGAKILDIGGGTGRHALPLAKLGYEVTVIDISEKMLESLKSKFLNDESNTEYNINVIKDDVLKYDFKDEKFDLVIMMWNSFNEIALTDEDALHLLQKCKEVLNSNGKILINIDNANKVDPGHFDFKTSFMQNGLTYNLHWTTENFIPTTNTSTSKEHVEIFEGDKRVEELDTFITQRYWSLEQIKIFAETLKFEILNKEIKESEELYLELRF